MFVFIRLTIDAIPARQSGHLRTKMSVAVI